MTTEATTGTEKAIEPSGVGEAISMFQRDQEAAAAKQTEADAAKAAETQAEPAKEPSAAPAGEGANAGKSESKPASKPTLRLVDEKGNEVPFVFKADGKDITESSLEKVLEYAGYGYHGSQRLEALNAKEKLLNEQLAIIEMIDRAQKEGRLIIKEEGAKPDSETKEESEEDLLTDPKVKELQARVKKTEEELQKTAGLFIKENIDKAYKELKGQIEAKKAEYPAAREAEVWKLLELQDEKTGKPLHDVASAMKTAHEKETEYLMTVPLPEQRRQQIIADYLAEKAKAEEPPVGAPAGAGPGGGGATKAAEEPKEFGSMAEAIEAFKKDKAKAGEPPKF